MNLPVGKHTLDSGLDVLVHEDRLIHSGEDLLNGGHYSAITRTPLFVSGDRLSDPS
jgi:hypothetical protein